MDKAKVIAQSGYPSYELHTLGWKAFQDLCATILSDILGQTFQTFSPGKDGGRDGAFRGKWKPQGSDELKGSFTAQCKFTSRTGPTLNPGDLTDDIEKASKLASKGLSDIYLLMTNYKVTGTAEDGLRKAFEQAGVKTFLVFGQEKISQIITESPRLRRLVPRVYGLGDLSQILDERAYAQAEQLLLSLQDDLSKFVPTAAYRRSARALSQHGFVLLLGEPASGKSTIAATLALSAADEWDCSVLKTESASDFKRHWNPHDPRQFFWVDDAFGATQYQPQFAQEWNRVFSELKAAVHRGARVVFTSRDYIYRRAISDLKVTAFPLLNDSQVVINVEELTLSEKQEILYNHIKLGNQPKDFRKAVKVYLGSVAASPHFRPEIARRLGSQAFTKHIALTQKDLSSFVERPEEFLLSVLRGLGPDEKSALALVFMHGGALKSPISFGSPELQVLTRMGGTQSGVREAITAMKDSLVKNEYSELESTWTFKHPTIRDAFASLVADDKELLDIYLSGTPTNKLVQEVVCGKVEIEGAKVVVPPSRYSEVVARLEKLPADWKSEDLLNRFLAYRCSKEFLRIYITSHETILERIARPHSYLYAVSGVNLVKRLQDEGLLPSKYRTIFVDRVKQLAIETPDHGFLTVEAVRSILTQQEVRAILKAIREKLIPALDDTIDVWRDNYPRDEDPEGYFSELLEALSAYKDRFRNDQTAVDLIEEAEGKIEDVIEELRSEFREPDDIYDRWEEASTSRSSTGHRSIFDDIDE